jgi:hypothetical protein
MISKTNVPPAKRKKPRGEQLLDRIDKNPNDRELTQARRRLPRDCTAGFHKVDNVCGLPPLRSLYRSRGAAVWPHTEVTAPAGVCTR